MAANFANLHKHFLALHGYIKRWLSKEPEDMHSKSGWLHIFKNSGMSRCKSISLRLCSRCQLLVFCCLVTLHQIQKERKHCPCQQTRCTRATGVVCICYRLLASSRRRVSTAGQQRKAINTLGEWRELRGQRDDATYEWVFVR